jgi:hypothetical protein
MADMVNVRAPNQAQRYKAPEARLGRSQISLAHSHKTSFDAGDLIPYVFEEVVPGDTFTCKTTIFGRVWSPLDAPIMDDIEMSIDFFFVPNRLVWENWEYFLGAHDAAGAQDTTYTIPSHSTGGTIAEGSIHHYMGVPIGLSTTAETISALPQRGLRLIYNEWYRDQNLIDELSVSTGNGPDGIQAGLQKSAKRHDYFTSALPYLQKGTAQTAELTGTIAVATDALDNEDVGVYQSGDSGWRKMDIATGTHLEMDGTAASEYLYADFSLPGTPGGTVGGISLNSLREAAAIQRLLEKDARAGTRHPELIRAHFGVDVPDYRTQRPEYLGGGVGFINVSPVANTSATATENQGELAGTAAGTLTCNWAKSFVEHGYVFGILRARGAVSYQQGLDKKWSRSTKYDFLWPELAQLGEQPIYNKELYLAGTSADDDVFGYQERYAEYRYGRSKVTGQFDSAASSSLDFWHLAEDFGSAPSLNQTFIEDATPMSRVTTVDTQHDFIVDGRIDLRVARILPVRPTPSLMPARW